MRMLSAAALALALALAAAAHAAEVAKLEGGAPPAPATASETVYLVFMPGTKVAHSVVMPSLEQCREATQFSSSKGARCVVVRKPAR